MEINSIKEVQTGVKNVINDFIFHCRFEKNLNEKSINAYTVDLMQFYVFVKEEQVETDIRSVKKDIIKKYIQNISHYKTKTIKRKMASLKAMFNYLEYEDDDFINPFRKIKFRLKDAFTLPSVMTIAEVQKIFCYLYDSKNNISDKTSFRYKSLVRDIAVLELLFATGIRVSELCELKVENIEIKSSTIKVFGKGSRERIIPICNSDTKKILLEYFKLFSDKINPNESFFRNRLSNQFSAQSVRLMLKQYAKLAGISKAITPHTFRHTFATLLLEGDVDIRYIQNLLGHSTITTTQIYTHINSDVQKRILTKKHPRKKLNLN